MRYNAEYDIKKWSKISERVKKRDRYRCQVKECETFSVMLTSHHIIPRVDGGKDTLGNLITLCDSCHDKIEEAIDEGAVINTRKKIHNFVLRPKKVKKVKGALCWQQWVYGGYKNPLSI